MRDAAASPLLLATDAADTLAATGIPFREAHEIVGRQGRSLDAAASKPCWRRRTSSAERRRSASGRRAVALASRRNGGGSSQSLSPAGLAARAIPRALTTLRLCDDPTEPTLRLPKGFTASGVRAGIRKKRPDLGLIVRR